MIVYSPRKRRKTQSDIRQKIILWGLLGLLTVIVLGFIGAFAVFAWFSRDLPSPGKLSETTDSSTVFYDRNGKILYEVYKDKNRFPVGVKDISKYMKEATISIEDKDFYKHSGISERGMIRAFLNILMGKRIQSGSTITQQLIKNILLDSRQVASRKIKEIILASEVERRYTKDQILEMYLNEVPYGGSFWGIGSAARGYFGKDPKDLNILESAILAGLPQSPSVYSPFIGRKDAWKTRAKAVLRRMREDGYITSKQEADSSKQMESMKFSSPKLSINAPHFVFYVKDQIEKEYGEALLNQGLRVKTTLSLEIQNKIQSIVHDEIEKLKDYDLGNSAVVVLDSQTGEILAMVGSYDFNNEEFGKFNATLGLRQPGSTLKPFAYALAFEKGYTPATVLMDVQTVFHSEGMKDYIPVNYNGKFNGPIQIRFALGNSLNIPAVKMLAMLGLKDFMTKADDLGMHTLAPTSENMRRLGLSMVLGGGEVTLLDLTRAYTALARGGSVTETQDIDEIKSFDGKILFKSVKAKEKKVYSPEVAFLISHILSDNNARAMEFGTRSYLNVPGKTVAVKTGTSNDKRDNWAVGYTKSITVGVWAGNNDNHAMNQKIASGATGASSIWYKIMNELLKSYGDGIMDKPDDIEATMIDAYLGGLPKDGYPTRSEYFIKGTEPSDVSPFYKSLKISKSNGKLANEVEARLGQYDTKDFIVISENDPVSTDGVNRWQEGIDKWESEQPEDKYKPPKDTSDASADALVVSIRSPNGSSTVNSNNVEIRAKIASLTPVKNIKFYLNGSEVKNFDGDNKEPTETLNLKDGVYKLQVVARNEKDQSGESTIIFGVNRPWDSEPTATLTPTPSPSP